MSGPSESQIQADIRLALGLEPGLVLWRNSVGVTRSWDATTGAERVVHAGLPVGSADLVGILTLTSGVGRFLALEVKSARGRLRPEQVTWLELVRRMGGFAAVVRSVDEARAAVWRARRGERE